MRLALILAALVFLAPGCEHKDISDNMPDRVIGAIDSGPDDPDANPDDPDANPDDPDANPDDPDATPETPAEIFCGRYETLCGFDDMNADRYDDELTRRMEISDAQNAYATHFANGMAILIGASHRSVGSAFGITAGALIGHRIGRELDERDREYLEDNYAMQLGAVLTPLAADPSHPFPHIRNLRPALAVVVRAPDTGEERPANTLEVVLDRLSAPLQVVATTRPADAHVGRALASIQRLVTVTTLDLDGLARARTGSG